MTTVPVQAWTGVTAEEWLRYERVRRSGRYNMVAEWPLAARDARLDGRQYGLIQKHYGAIRAMVMDKLLDEALEVE